MSKILIIEDDVDLREGLAFSLQMDVYDVICAGSKKEGMEKLREHHFSLIILDCNLPDGSGFDFFEEIRNISDSAILMLTARDTEVDEVKALELGIDDYMRKPFSLAVLKARIKKLLGRGGKSQLLCSQGIAVDTNRGMVWFRGEEISCSKVEYKLLLYFLEHKNQVLTKEQILQRIWDCEGKFVEENTVSVNIRRLRIKIEEDPTKPMRIQTIRGIGYRWREE